MRTMERLCFYLAKRHPGYTAELDRFDSYPGFYLVYITGGPLDLTSTCYFTSCRDFREWIDGVILD